MTARGRPPGQGKVPGSGRKKGSLDKQARTLISEEVAFDILKTYKRLGPDWLFEVAKSRPDLFINQCLSRIMPSPQKDDPDVVVNNNTLNVDYMSDLQIAQRVAFALSLGQHAQVQHAEEAAPIATVQREEPEPMTPQEACDWKNPTPARDGWQPEPVEDPELQRWGSEIALTPEARADAALVRETRTATLENYHGSAAEQGGYTRPERTVQTKASAGELCRRLSRRSELL